VNAPPAVRFGETDRNELQSLVSAQIGLRRMRILRQWLVNSVIGESMPDVWDLGLNHRSIAAPSGYGQPLQFAGRLANGERVRLK